MSSSLFESRHIGLNEKDSQFMLDKLGYDSLNQLCHAVVPESIQSHQSLMIDKAISEEQAMAELKTIAGKNQLKKSLIGQGYYNTFTPSVIQRNVLENPAWYTAYTPYQPEISQGRLEVLFYFQTLVTELTKMDMANASLLDEATAAAEAMSLCYQAAKRKRQTFFVSSNCHPQTIELLKTRAAPLGIHIELFNEHEEVSSSLLEEKDAFGVLLQYPTTFGDVNHYENLIEQAHQIKALVVMATDLLALTLLTPPGDLGADIVVGNSQRFGVPMAFGGPHAAFMSVKEKYKRLLPGRLVGQSIDAHGNNVYRLTLQTREQHIRRENATSNICTAQALLAMMATFYACYHGPQGLKNIARRVYTLTHYLAENLKNNGIKIINKNYFDTLHLGVDDVEGLLNLACDQGYNLNNREQFSKGSLTLSLDETTTLDDVNTILSWFDINSLQEEDILLTTPNNIRTDNYLSQEVFNRYHSETEMMRYLRYLSDKDIALDRAMIPLGSCTMKLNSASEMTPVSWLEFSQIHPFAPQSQTLGYQQMITELESMLAKVTGYDAVSLQPNSGAQGEYAGLLAIKAYHESRGDNDRDICLIPSSAHGTNPASAQMVNFKVVVVKCDEQGNVDLNDLEQKIIEFDQRIAAIMITYPSTHGVFEEQVVTLCEMIHKVGGQVYIDGANMNALIGLALPGKFGGDVSHLNLHKTFCIPHGGGGPGVGPIGVGKHLEPFLPKDNINLTRQGDLVSAAAFGSAAILPISWMYIRMMGAEGLKKATQTAILNANYIAHRLKDKYPILYTGKYELVAHECILDTRFMKEQGISVDDIAKRLMDFGFHAPTMSFPVPGTLMVEPTESESLFEIERFCQAMEIIFDEYEAVKSGVWPTDNNPLVNAPHTAEFLLRVNNIVYSRHQAAYPSGETQANNKYWPPVGRVDNAYGDKNLICTCPPLEEYLP